MYNTEDLVEELKEHLTLLTDPLDGQDHEILEAMNLEMNLTGFEIYKEFFDRR